MRPADRPGPCSTKYGPRKQKIGTDGQAAARDIAYLFSGKPSITPRGRGHLKLETDDLDWRTTERSLAYRRLHLIEKAEITTLTPADGRSVLPSCRPSLPVL
jgi:hypothetical protein